MRHPCLQVLKTNLTMLRIFLIYFFSNPKACYLNGTKAANKHLATLNTGSAAVPELIVGWKGKETVDKFTANMPYCLAKPYHFCWCFKTEAEPKESPGWGWYNYILHLPRQYKRSVIAPLSHLIIILYSRFNRFPQKPRKWRGTWGLGWKISMRMC